MFGITVSPKGVLKQMGVDADDELVELATLFYLRLTSAPDKKVFVKDALRKALATTGGTTRR